MTERTPVILGLSRQAVLAGLPMPYALAVATIWFMPFIWFKWLPWLFTIVIWYGLARLFTAINPHGHKVVAVIMQKTPPKFSLKRDERLKRYVQ